MVFFKDIMVNHRQINAEQTKKNNPTGFYGDDRQQPGIHRAAGFIC